MKPLYDKTGKLKGYVDKYTGEEFGFPVIVGRILMEMVGL
jgi:hypothetical protein